MRKTTLLIFAVLFGTAFLSAATGWFNDFLTLKVNGFETLNNYYLSDSDPASGAAALHGANLGTVTSLEITGCDMKYWSDTQDRTGGAFYYEVKSEDGSVQILAPVEIIWDQTALGGNDYQGTKTTTINITNAIMQNGTYQLHVWAKSWGTNQGDSWLSNSSANYVSTFTVSRPVIVSGATGIADNTSFETLKAAFDAINAQPDQSGKNIEIQIEGSTTETASAVLNQPATASWVSLTIYPTAVATISGNFIGPLVDLNGADNVTINGKLNKIGTSKSLTLIQQESTDNTSSAVRLINDANSNTISNCILKGSGPNSSSVGGIVSLSTASSGGSGNDNNTISFNDFTSATSTKPGSAIFSQGTSGAVNDNNTIDNNNFFGLYDGNTVYIIRLGTQNSAFTITNNNLYETSEIIPVAANIYWGIYLSSSFGSGFNISNNYIGGSEPLCAGVPFKKSNAFSNQFTGIFLSTSASLTDANEIQGNVIKNIEWKNTNVKKDFTCFSGFGNIANFGTTSPNTITNITIENGAVSGSLFYGYNIGNGSGLFTVKNNTISNITISNPDGANGTSFYGLYKSNSSGEVNFNENSISNISLTGTSTGNSQAVFGVYLLGTNRTYTFTVADNIIQGINNSSSRTDATNCTKGIYAKSTLGSGSIVNNKIYNISASDATLPAIVAGIDLDVTSTSTATVCANNMISLGNANPGMVYGIMQNTGLAKVYHNSVYITGNSAFGSFESCALNAIGSTAGREFLNNILINARSNSATADGKHFIVKYAAATNLVSNYNVVNFTGTGGTLGMVGTTEYASGEEWSTGTGLDAESNVAPVNFTAPATADLTIAGSSVQDPNLKVPSLAAVTTDILGTTRNTEFTYAGAHEAALPFLSTGFDKAIMQAGLQITKNGIFIPANGISNIEIYSLNGTLVDKAITNNSYSRALSNGAYIVKINGKAVKFVK